MATVLLVTTGTNSVTLKCAHLRSSTAVLCSASCQALSTAQKDTLFKKHQVSFVKKIHILGTNLGTRSVAKEVKDHIIKTTLDKSIPSVNPESIYIVPFLLTDFYLFWDKGNSLLLEETQTCPPPNTYQRTCPSNAVAADRGHVYLLSQLTYN